MNEEPLATALNQLSATSKEIVASLIRQLADREGISDPIQPSPGLQTPAEGIDLWTAKLRSECRSGRTGISILKTMRISSLTTFVLVIKSQTKYL